MEALSSQKRTARLFLWLFLLLCLVPSLGVPAFGGSKAGANEIFAPRPKLTRKDGTYNLNYLTELTDYVTDRLFLRQEAITLRNRLSTTLFATSPSEKVTLGRGNWLFYTEPLETAPLSDRELWCAAENLRLLEEYTRSRGSDFLFVLAPNKSTLCRDMVSNGTVSDDGQHLESLLREMGVSHSSLYSALAFQDDYFYHTDSHWNGIGAAVAADTILSSLDRQSRYANGPFSEGSGHAGDLSEMLYPAAPDVETDWLYPFTFTYTSDYHAPNDPLITTEGGGEGSLYCYRDSFGNDLHPYLAESFRTATFSRKTAFDLTALDADALLIELVERNIDYLYQYDHTYPAPERELSCAAQKTDPISVRLAEAGALTRISGEIGEVDNAPIYLRRGDTLYECAPRPDGFTLCVEAFAGGELLFCRNGQYYAAELETISN